MISNVLSDTLLTINYPSANNCDSIISTWVNVIPENRVVDSSGLLVCLELNAESYKWYDCRDNMPITGVDDRVFSPSDTGLYKVEITLNGCVRWSDCIPYFSVGLNENHFQNSIIFYPNPSRGIVNIELLQNQESLLIKVRNIHGQLVQEEQFVNQNNLQLQLNGKPGIYFIELVNAKGERANVKVLKR